MYLYSIDYDNYGIVIADGDDDGNDVTENDDSYDEYTYTSDDDDDVDDDEILTVECNNSVIINFNDKWLNNNVLILRYLLRIVIDILSNSAVNYRCQYLRFVYFEVLWPSQPMGSCQVRSGYLTTPLLGRLSPLSG